MVGREVVVVVVLTRGEEKGGSYLAMNHWAKEIAVGRSREINMCVCVCVCERERERERMRERKRERERERENC